MKIIADQPDISSGKKSFQTMLIPVVNVASIEYYYCSDKTITTNSRNKRNKK
jgi:hypothetical protein